MHVQLHGAERIDSIRHRQESRVATSNDADVDTTESAPPSTARNDDEPLDPGKRPIPDRRHLPLLLYGIVLICVGLAFYLFGVALVVPRYLFGLNRQLLPLNEWIVWYSGLPIATGFALALADLFLLFPAKRRLTAEACYDPILDHRLTVALTAYNDEQSIAVAVRDFLDHPSVHRVIVVSNNSTDRTFDCAQAAGAITFNEPTQGYGYCVHRCLSEAVELGETTMIVLCEGDCTFSARDLDKFLAYARHADIVNGTRTVERLRAYQTQLSTFMYYGNLFVAKLLEVKHLGATTITDVGTTYKLCHRAVLQRLLPALDPRVNLEFNAYFLDVALQQGCSVVECPITFHPRVGLSKGGNINNLRALKVGCQMMLGIIFGWRRSSVG
jgi:hypothetical protein